MKKILSFAMAAVLLMASCAKEYDSLSASGETVDVTFSAKLPIEVSRTVGDGSQANVLNYAIYDTAGNLFADYPYEDDVTVSGNKATVKLELVKGQSYNVAFWAQNENAPYTFDRAAGTVTVNYDNEEKSNDETYDAFYKLEPITVSGPAVKDVVLKRPFAQINLGATKEDVEKAAALGVEIDKSMVTLTNVYQTLNLYSGVASNPTTATVAFNYNDLPGNDLTVNNVAYEYIAANYILANTEADVTELTFSVKDGDVEINTDINVPSVNYKRNFRTNILGRLLTSSVDFNIVIDGTPEGDIAPGKEAELYLAMQTEGKYTLSEDMTLSEPFVIEEGTNFTLDLNGKTISLDKDMYADENGKAVKENVIVNNGTLEITGGTISSLGVNGGSAIYNAGTLTVTDATLMGAPCDDNVKVGTTYWASYAVNHYGESLTFNNVTVVSNHGAISLYGDAVINDCNVTMNGRGGSAHVFYVGGDGTEVVINGGNYTHNGNTDGSLGYIMTGTTVTVNSGTFNASNGGYGFATYTGTLNINGGTFNSMPINWGGPIHISGGTFKSQPTAAWIAAGYKALQNNGKWVVVEADVDAVASTPAELNDALTAGATTVALAAGEYKIPTTSNAAQGKTLTIKGTGNPEDVTVVAQNTGAAEGNCDYCFRGSKVTFDGVTIATEGTYFPGYAYMEGTFNNCIINGVYTTYRSSSFNGCTFNVSGDNYNLWTWGAEEVVLTDCTFNCDGKAVLLYGGANTVLTVNDCTFNDNGDDTITDKAAIEVGDGYGKSYTLVVNNATVNGFAINPKGYNTGTTLWGNKNSMKPEKLSVTVDGENAYKVVVADAAVMAEAVKNGGNISLAGDVTLDKIDFTTQTQDVVIDGNGNTITTSSKYGVEATAGKNVTLKNAKVEITADGDYIAYAAGFKIANGDYQGQTIKLENCEIRMHNTDWAYAVTMPASVKNLNLVIDNCILEGAVALQCWGDNNTITVTNSQLICNYTTSALYTSYCAVLQAEGANRAENNTLTISGCEFSYSGVNNFNATIYSVTDRATGANNKVTVTDCTFNGVQAY